MKNKNLWCQAACDRQEEDVLEQSLERDKLAENEAQITSFVNADAEPDRFDFAFTYVSSQFYLRD